jgi:predicted dehydrogenase
MIYLIGTGPMSQSYAEVLKSIGKVFTVIGRGVSSAQKFEEKIGVKPIIGGLEKFIEVYNFSIDDHIIITTGTEALMPILKKAVDSGATKILVEKPAAISIQELLENADFLMAHVNKIFVAYNRRFYDSVIEAKKLIDDDGGLESMHFEFTEWAHRIEPLLKASGVKENWFFANSTHVVDLAFFIAGKPINWSSYSHKGHLTWHPKTKFCGAGFTENGVIFSYHSNWESAGRWGIELMTFNRKIILRPLEEIQVQLKGSTEVNPIKMNVNDDFKPGLVGQVTAFLNSNSEHLITIGEHIENTKNIYQKIIEV